MRLLQLRTLGGPSVYLDRPAVLARFAHDAAWRAPEPAARLFDWLGASVSSGDGLSALPTLDTASTDPEPSAYRAAVAAVQALALRAGLPVPAVRCADGLERGTCSLAVAYSDEGPTRLLVETIAEALAAAAADTPFPLLDERTDEIRRLADVEALGPSTAAIVAAVERRGIPWTRLSDGNFLRLGWGANARFVQASITGHSSALAVEIACDKPRTKQLLGEALLPVPRGEVVGSAAGAVAAAETLGYPVVVKPRDGNHGRGVSVGLATPEAVEAAFEIARAISRRVIVEEQFVGRDFRVLVVDGRVVAAAERRPPEVVGDGVSTLAALVERVNRDPRRGDGHEKPMTKIRLDDVVDAHLAACGLSLDAVPAEGEPVQLCPAANLSRGGTAHDVTDRLHPEVRAVCERAARVVGLDVCGVDLVAPSVEVPLGKHSGIVELNAAPGLRMHLAPSEGVARDVGESIVERLFPGNTPGRIPLLAVTGTNGKTTTTRMIAHGLKTAGVCAGMTSTEGVHVDGALVARGDTTGPASARAVLADPAVEVAVLETARGGMLRRGLAFDWCDVAVLTNVTADHLGQDGIETVDDLYRIKRLLAERVREGGTLVLNADDERLARLPMDKAIAGIPRTVVFFSLLADSPVVSQHRAAGGRALFLRGGLLVEAEGTTERVLLRADEIPVTMGGAARFQIANALAAAAALRAHGVPASLVAAALRSFTAGAHNAGRANLFRLGEGYVMLDYGHNPDGFANVCALAGHWRRAGRRVTGIIGAPGDRTEEIIRTNGRIAAQGFSRLIVHEDRDLRGRPPGETPRLLCEAAREARLDVECSIVLNEVEALRGELDRVRAGEIAVVFFEKSLDPLRAVLAAEGAVPVETVEERAAPAVRRRTS